MKEKVLINFREETLKLTKSNICQDQI